MAGGWEGSDRKSQLPANWDSEIRPAVLARDGHRCTWIIDGFGGLGDPAAYLAGYYDPRKRCPQRATDVDHIDDAHDHRLEKLRSLCSGHHDRKSSIEGNMERARLRAMLKKPVERHPGLPG